MFIISRPRPTVIISPSGPWRTRSSKIGLIALFGLGTLAVNILHLYEDEPTAAAIFGIGLPALVSLGFIIGAWWLARSSIEEHQIERLLIWAFGGAVLVGLLGAGFILYQTFHGSVIYDTGYVVVNSLETGAVIGLLVGYYDGKRIAVEEMLREQRDTLSRREASLERKVDRLNRFASIVSHDLRNPINLASGHLQLAREADDPTEHLDAIEKANGRMQEIIDVMLELAREGEPVTEDELERVVLSTIASQSWGTVDTMGATIDIADDLEFSADPGRLRHVFENLLLNAIEHGGPDVSVRVGALDDGRGFFVEDDGPGIDDDISPFEAGSSTAEEGIGLGLSIVKNIVQAHRWTIQAVEGETGGARFEVTGVDGTRLD